MNERSNLIPVTEDEIREHYGRISRGAVFIAKDDGGELFDAVEAYVRLREIRVVDPRIARIEMLLDQRSVIRADGNENLDESVTVDQVRAILAGGDA